ncbi:nucleoside diphosphate kinase A-like [Periplaneta americana]|uniref:nucleoside diphosphate kinase A-like n=1 Tax=Periplaneta americana TaxID=6978 RepID=UPI0037E8770C
MSGVKERTLIIIHCDGIQRTFMGRIIERFESKGFRIVALKFIWPTEDKVKKHYAEHVNEPFFSTLIADTLSGPVVVMVWEGPNVVKIGRLLIGATDPKDSHPGTIRGDVSIQDGCKNTIHGSDTVDSANREISLWFEPNEMVDWQSAYDAWIVECSTVSKIVKEVCKEIWTVLQPLHLPTPIEERLESKKYGISLTA